MVFDKNLSMNEIENYENDCLEKISKLPLMFSLKEELLKRKWSLKIEIQHTEPNLNSYCSYLVMDVFNENGERVPEYDEPNCCLMFCETICYMRHGHIIGIDLITDKECLESLKLLIKQVKKY